jgi:hypothetical protein
MTTIAWKNGQLAADKRLDQWMTTCKIFKLPDGSHIAGAGMFDDVIEVAAWFSAGCPPETKPQYAEDNTDLLLMSPDGACYWLTDPFLRKQKVAEEYYAIGSGAKYALGAMAAGKSAKEAVLIASRYDPDTGNGVDVVRSRKKRNISAK